MWNQNVQNHPPSPVPSISPLLLLMFLKLASEAIKPLPVAQYLGCVPGSWRSYFLVASVQTLISEADSHKLVDIVLIIHFSSYIVLLLFQCGKKKPIHYLLYLDSSHTITLDWVSVPIRISFKLAPSHFLQERHDLPVSLPTFVKTCFCSSCSFATVCVYLNLFLHISGVLMQRYICWRQEGQDVLMITWPPEWLYSLVSKSSEIKC